MPLLDVVTVNEEHENKEDLLEVIWRALEYFPGGLWEGANYLGNLNIKYDLKIKSKDDVYGAFMFSSLMEKIRRVRRMLQVKDLLLAVTCDPIITVYHRFEDGGFKRVANLVYDYVSSEIGVVSLFRIEYDRNAARVVAHGLGHNQGLRHHAEPIDVMCEGLLEHEKLRNDGFCNECLKKMMKPILGEI
ncbi:MAG: hypothetical protein QXR06_03665 [Candidatus Bathyarchaeia archaeon]|nr:hypothetical protein [Candidatus Bathyarchaeota archaeon]